MGPCERENHARSFLQMCLTRGQGVQDKILGEILDKLQQKIIGVWIR
jgi:hypothetical protein